MSREGDELRLALEDISTGVAGLGYEVQALNTSLRAIAARYKGSDPLRGTLYDPDSDEPETEIPQWVQPERRLPEQDGRFAGVVFAAAVLGWLLVGVLLLHIVGSW